MTFLFLPHICHASHRARVLSRYVYHMPAFVSQKLIHEQRNVNDDITLLSTLSVVYESYIFRHRLAETEPKRQWSPLCATIDNIVVTM